MKFGLPLAFFGILLCTSCGTKEDPAQQAIDQRVAEKQTLERDIARLQNLIDDDRKALTANNAEVDAERKRLDALEQWKTGQGQEQHSVAVEAEARLVDQMENESKSQEARIDSLNTQHDLLTARLAGYADVDSRPKLKGLK